MNNKSVLSFLKCKSNKVTYGKWKSEGQRLYFNHVLIAEVVNNTFICHPKTLTECGHEYPTFYAIEKVIKYIKSL